MLIGVAVLELHGNSHYLITLGLQNILLIYRKHVWWRKRLQLQFLECRFCYLWGNYSDPEPRFQEIMNSSADNDDLNDIEDHFLRNFQCVACHAVPIFEQASQIVAAWASELLGVVVCELEPNQENSNSRVMVFCGSCRRFWHATYFFACQFQHQYFRHLAKITIQLAEVYPVVSQFECQNCRNI